MRAEHSHHNYPKDTSRLVSPSFPACLPRCQWLRECLFNFAKKKLARRELLFNDESPTCVAYIVRQLLGSQVITLNKPFCSISLCGWEFCFKAGNASEGWLQIDALIAKPQCFHLARGSLETSCAHRKSLCDLCIKMCFHSTLNASASAVWHSIATTAIDWNQIGQVSPIRMDGQGKLGYV